MARSLNMRNWGYNGPWTLPTPMRVALHTAPEAASMRSDDRTPSPVFTNGESFTVTATAVVLTDGTLVELGPAVGRFLHHDAPYSVERDGTIPWTYPPVAWVDEAARMTSARDSHIAAWPSSGYACDLCWAAQRWPWEPARACPWNVDPANTLCARHKTHVSTGLTH